MPRISRNLTDNGYYHILSRGNDKKNIFRCEEDYLKFFTITSKYLAKYKIYIYHYYEVIEHGVIHPGSLLSSPSDTAASVRFFAYGDSRSFLARHDSMLAGHNHLYAHCLIGGVHHLILGGGGSSLYPASGRGEDLIKAESVLHFAKINLQADSATFKIVRPDGVVIDEFSFGEIPKDSGKINEVIEKDIYLYKPSLGKTLFIEMQGYENIKMEVLDPRGTVILTEIIKRKKTSVNMSWFGRGVYVVKFSQKNLIKSKRVVLY